MDDDLNRLIQHLLTISSKWNVDQLKRDLQTEEYRDSRQVKELFTYIAKICKQQDSRFFTTISRGTSLYRARSVNRIGDSNIQEAGISITDVTSGFNEDNSKEAPFGKAPAGRNNYVGVSYFYGSDDPATACSELKCFTRTTISLAEFELLCDISIVDMVKVKKFLNSEIEEAKMALGAYWGDVMYSFQVPVNSDTDYRITQIISEEFRKQGCAGLRYNSFYGCGDNYTLFNCGSNILAFKGSGLVQLMYSNQIFWDYNNRRMIESFPDHDFYQYNEDIAQGQLEKIKKSWIIDQTGKAGKSNE